MRGKGRCAFRALQTGGRGDEGGGRAVWLGWGVVRHTHTHTEREAVERAERGKGKGKGGAHGREGESGEGLGSNKGVPGMCVGCREMTRRESGVCVCAGQRPETRERETRERRAWSYRAPRAVG